MKSAFALFFVFFLSGCEIIRGGDANASLLCGSKKVCSYVETKEDRVIIGIANDSDDVLYVPWINGARSLVSGFDIRLANENNSNKKSGSDAAAEIPFIGDTLLVPHSYYGVSITKEEARHAYGLDVGCQMVIVVFEAATSRVDRDQRIESASSVPTRLCL